MEKMFIQFFKIASCNQKTSYEVIKFRARLCLLFALSHVTARTHGNYLPISVAMLLNLLEPKSLSRKSECES